MENVWIVTFPLYDNVNSLKSLHDIPPFASQIVTIILFILPTISVVQIGAFQDQLKTIACFDDCLCLYIFFKKKNSNAILAENAYIFLITLETTSNSNFSRKDATKFFLL